MGKIVPIRPNSVKWPFGMMGIFIFGVMTIRYNGIRYNGHKSKKSFLPSQKIASWSEVRKVLRWVWALPHAPLVRKRAKSTIWGVLNFQPPAHCAAKRLGPSPREKAINQDFTAQHTTQVMYVITGDERTKNDIEDLHGICRPGSTRTTPCALLYNVVYLDNFKIHIFL